MSPKSKQGTLLQVWSRFLSSLNMCVLVARPDSNTYVIALHGLPDRALSGRRRCQIDGSMSSEVNPRGPVGSLNPKYVSINILPAWIKRASRLS